MLKQLSTIAITACFAAAVPAQVLQTDFLMVGADASGGLFAVDAKTSKATLLANHASHTHLRNASCIVADPANNLGWFVGTKGAADIYYVTAVRGAITSSKKLNTLSMTGDTIIRVMAIANDKLVFGSDSRVGTLPVGGGKPTELFKFQRTSNNFPAIASDGRYLYTNIHNISSNGYRTGGGSVWRHDLQDITKRVSLFSVDRFPTNIVGLAVDASGHLLVTDKGNFAAPKLRQFNLRTTTKLQDVTLPWMSLSGGRMAVAQDPVANTVVVTGQGVTGFSDRNHYAVVVDTSAATWKLGTPFMPVAYELTGLASRRTPGLVRRGFECPSKASPSLVSLAAGRPNTGNTKYSLDLLGPQNMVAALLIGAGKGFNAVKIAPTTCELGVNPILTLAGVIPANGRLSVGLPIPSNAAGFFVDSQWIVFESGANSIGVVTKQVGGIYVR